MLYLLVAAGVIWQIRYAHLVSVATWSKGSVHRGGLLLKMLHVLPFGSSVLPIWHFSILCLRTTAWI